MKNFEKLFLNKRKSQVVSKWQKLRRYFINLKIQAKLKRDLKNSRKINWKRVDHIIATESTIDMVKSILGTEQFEKYKWCPIPNLLPEGCGPKKGELWIVERQYNPNSPYVLYGPKLTWTNKRGKGWTSI